MGEREAAVPVVVDHDLPCLGDGRRRDAEPEGLRPGPAAARGGGRGARPRLSPVVQIPASALGRTSAASAKIVGCALAGRTSPATGSGSTSARRGRLRGERRGGRRHRQRLGRAWRGRRARPNQRDLGQRPARRDEIRGFRRPRLVSSDDGGKPSASSIHTRSGADGIGAVDSCAGSAARVAGAGRSTARPSRGGLARMALRSPAAALASSGLPDAGHATEPARRELGRNAWLTPMASARRTNGRTSNAAGSPRGPTARRASRSAGPQALARVRPAPARRRRTCASLGADGASLRVPRPWGLPVCSCVTPRRTPLGPMAPEAISQREA